MAWSLSAERSVYLQLIDILKQKILSGEYKPGEILPSVRDLAADAEVNPNTMQRALTELERIGFLYTQRTNGRFVSEDAARLSELRRDSLAARAREFLEDMKKSGLSAEESIELVQKVIAEMEKR